MLVKDLLGCEVASNYSTQELGHMAFLCPHGSYHVSDLYYLIEDDITQDDPTLYPEVVVTPLFQTAMPMLRYKPGDLMVQGNRPCTCGRSLRIIKEIAGRSTQLYLLPSGRHIPPLFWDALFDEKDLRGEVLQYQIVYGKEDNIIMRLVRAHDSTSELESNINKHLRTHFQGEVTVTFKYVDHIPVAPSGKYHTVVYE
jgi:phenylacetate-CoA ligase